MWFIFRSGQWLWAPNIWLMERWIVFDRTKGMLYAGPPLEDSRLDITVVFREGVHGGLTRDDRKADPPETVGCFDNWFDVATW